MRAFLGVLLLVFGASWWFLASSINDNRISSEDWTWGYTVFGFARYIEQAGDLDASLFETPINEDDIYTNEFRWSVKELDTNSNTATLVYEYSERNVITQAVVSTVQEEFLVDSRSGRYTDEELSEYYFQFPANLEKQSYTLWHSYYGVMEFDFEREETIDDLNVFVFVTEKDEFVEANAAWPLAEEEQAICYDYQSKWWVEPVTGEVVSHEDTCSEIWAVDVNGKDLYVVGRYHFKPTTDGQQERVGQVRSKREVFLFNTLYAPLSLSVIGLVLLATSFFLPIKRGDES